MNRGSHSAPQEPYASALSYNAAGALESLPYGNGATETRSYNSRLQLTSQSLVKSGVVLQRYDYQYGQVNQATGAVDALKNNGQLGRTDAFIGGTPTSATKQWEERFSYDSLSRLDLASEYRGDDGSLTGQADYDYDRYGNRMQSSAQNTNLTYVPVQASEINPLTNRFTANVSYDAAGQTTTDAKFRGMQYQYDPDGRMKWSANLDGSNACTAVYDGLGHRVQTTQPGMTKRFFYDMNGRVVAEYKATGGATGYGELRRLIVYAGGRLLATEEMNATRQTTYVLADRQGSTRVLMDAGGTVTSRHDYLPFGEELGAGTGMRTTTQGYSAADGVRQRYADTRLDDNTGLDHTLWRKLEPKSGRWTTPDPYGHSVNAPDPQSFNRYAYVHNDPVNLVDPSGLNEVIIRTFTWTWRYGFRAEYGFESGDTGGRDVPDSEPGGGGNGPQKPDREGIKNLVNEALAKDTCAQFAERILTAVSSKENPVLKGGDLFSIFALFLDNGGQYTRNRPVGSAGFGSPIGLIPNGATIFMASFPDPAMQTWSDAVTTIGELFHLAGSKAYYSDYELAIAVHNIPELAALLSLRPESNVFDPKYTGGDPKDKDNGGYSSYFHDIERTLCPVAKP